ncbi:hypothetical protein F5887DRAFT_1190637 [Amanita rubescens]|nr:hypothetical protein F5887DRAFT_1089684 [Amanita rubescens]KAF8327516.1 hypothetical protein F5887DRAFT_1190637 [Amanita rubescens]
MPPIQSKPPDPFRPITDLIANISGMITGLPASIPEGKRDGKLYHVITNIMGVDEDVFSTFNRRFDILFGEDCRNNDGRLLNIERGKYGMDAVCAYLKSIEWPADTPVEPVQLKLKRVLDEIAYLVVNAKDDGEDLQPGTVTDKLRIKLSGLTVTENGSQPRTKLSLVFDGANAMRTSKKGLKPVKAIRKKAGPKQTGSSKLQSAQSGSEQDDDYVPGRRQRQDSELSDGGEIDQEAVSEDSHIGQARTDALSHRSQFFGSARLPEPAIAGSGYGFQATDALPQVNASSGIVGILEPLLRISLASGRLESAGCMTGSQGRVWAQGSSESSFQAYSQRLNRLAPRALDSAR